MFKSEIFSQLYEYLNENTLLSDRQCGFRPQYGTNAALIEMCDLWLSHIDKGELNGVVFLDIRKAFYSINHKILLKKLKNQFAIYDNELKWFSSYLNNRTQVCYVNGQTSAPKIIVNGIPQGSILGPLLFLLYINDFPDNLEKSTRFLYADDTQISSFSDNYDTLVENLNCDLHNIHNWLSDNKLQHHLKKCKVMFIGSPRNLSSKIGDKPVLINNAPVPRTETFTCLGVKLDGKLNWDNHIDSICQKVSAGIGIMRRIKPYVPRKTLLDIYNGLVAIF